MTFGNLFPHQNSITPLHRSQITGHQAVVVWLTGLSGSGKSTIANQVEAILHHQWRAHTYLLDGDTIRTGLNKDLGFTVQDRQENIRRLGELCRLFVDAGLITITAFISPLQKDRDCVRSLLPPGRFLEVFAECPLETCEQRDPKGLYKKARAGQIKEFTGIDSIYEIPPSPELTLHTAAQSIEECARSIIDCLIDHQIISSTPIKDR